MTAETIRLHRPVSVTAAETLRADLEALRQERARFRTEARRDQDQLRQRIAALEADVRRLG